MKKKRKSSKGFHIFLVLAVLLILILVGLAVYLSFYMSGKSLSVLKKGFNEDVITIEEPDIYIDQNADGSGSHSFIFVGDSRTVGMENALRANQPQDLCRFIAKEGEGYDWLKNTGSIDLSSALTETPDAIVVLNLGVNDLASIDAYITYYQQLFADYSDAHFYVMSVNPVTDDCQVISNQIIDEFNQKMKAAFPDQYLDVYNYLLTGDFSTVDGLHYTDSTYLSIHYYTVNKLSSN